MALKNLATYFLNLVQQERKSPNFWMSEEYIRLAKLKWVEEDHLQGFKNDEGYWFFTPYNTTTKEFEPIGLVGFQDEYLLGSQTFWDHEFIYDPKNFVSLSGNKWKVFRRHIRKLDNPYWSYERLPDDEEMDKHVAALFLDWAEGRELFDPEIFTKFVIQGENRFGLFLNGVLMGVNIADTNFKYINYRICVDTGEEFLNEYLRWRFYTSEWVQDQNKLVNDGGCLGSEGLKRFKMKLRPIEIKNIYVFNI